MAIVTLKKITLCGLIEEKLLVLEQLQRLGKLHLIPLRESAESLESGRVDNAQEVVEALQYLNGCANKRHQIKASENFNLQQTVKQVLEIRAKIRHLSDRRDALLKRIKEIEPWGDFQFPGPEQLAGWKLWFYIVPRRMMRKLADVELIWQTVYQTNLNCYVVVISKQEPPEESMPVPRTHTGSTPLSTLQEQHNELELALEDWQGKKEAMTRWITLLTLYFTEAQDQAELSRAETMTREEAGVFALQGWLPKPEVEQMQRFADEHNLALLVEDPAPDDKPPTLLHNPSALQGGEDVVNFYQTPNYYGWDPSVTVFFSFTLFFAMILSDAGYAAVFALLIASRWRRFKQSETGRRLRVLAVTVVLVSLVWGVLSGGYFGYTPPPSSFLGKLNVLDINNFSEMMRLSIAIGVLHIAMANVISAYQQRHSQKSLSALGWTWLVLGGFCYWMNTQSTLPLLNEIGLSMMVVGGACVLWFSSERPLDRASSWLWRLLEGVEGLVGITKLFGDVLSYMRLFALGLASVSLALTFNHLAEQAYAALPGPGLLFSILILIIGHTLNLVLCLLSGVVHGLRLNFIEFYNWSVSDEGYPFKAFSKKESIND